jgi:hypothetical protein
MEIIICAGTAGEQPMEIRMLGRRPARRCEHAGRCEDPTSPGWNRAARAWRRVQLAGTPAPLRLCTRSAEPRRFQRFGQLQHSWGLRRDCTAWHKGRTWPGTAENHCSQRHEGRRPLVAVGRDVSLACDAKSGDWGGLHRSPHCDPL